VDTKKYKKYTNRCIFFVYKEKMSNKRCGEVIIAILIISVAILLLVLCLIKVNLAIEYNRQGVDDHIAVSFFILNGLIKYKFEIPKVDSKKKGVFFKKVKEKGKKGKEVSKKREEFSYSYILKKVQDYRKFMANYRKLFAKISNYLRCKVKVKKLDLDVTIGTDNAHHTAVLMGLCWSVVGIAISFIHNNLNLLEKNISIKPDYMGKKLKVDLFCILNVRIGHIIIVGLIYLMHIKPFRKISCAVNMTQNTSWHIF